MNGQTLLVNNTVASGYATAQVYNPSTTSPGASFDLNTSSQDWRLRNRTDGKFDILNVTNGNTSFLTFDTALGGATLGNATFAQDLVATGGFRQQLPTASYSNASAVTLSNAALSMATAAGSSSAYNWVATYAGSVVGVSMFANTTVSGNTTISAQINSGSVVALVNFGAFSLGTGKSAPLTKDTTNLTFNAGDLVKLTVSNATSQAYTGGIFVYLTVEA
jgi:hypothetical protein